MRTILGSATKAVAEVTRGRERFAAQLSLSETGIVTAVSSGTAKASGLPGAGFDELVRFPGDLDGIAFNPDEHEVGIVLLGDCKRLYAGAEVRRTGRVVDVPVGVEILERKLGTGRELRSVVRTMKAIALSSIVQYEHAVRSLAGYNQAVELGLIACFRDAAQPIITRPEKPSSRSVLAIRCRPPRRSSARFWWTRNRCTIEVRSTVSVAGLRSNLRP